MTLNTLENIPRKQGIYLFTNTINNKQYVGCSARKLSKRLMTGYKNEIRIKENRPIINALIEHGADNFQIEILHWFDEKVDDWTVLALETAFIEFYQSLTTQGGYNICLFGNNPKGRKHSSETLEKLRLFNTGKKMSPESKRKLAEYKGKKHWAYGTHLSKEQKLKLSNIRWREANPNFDNIIYHFKNILTNEIFIGVKCDFYKKYNLHPGGINNLISGKRKSPYKGWIYIKNQETTL